MENILKKVWNTYPVQNRRARPPGHGQSTIKRRLPQVIQRLRSTPPPGTLLGEEGYAMNAESWSRQCLVPGGESGR